MAVTRGARAVLIAVAAAASGLAFGAADAAAACAAPPRGTTQRDYIRESDVVLEGVALSGDDEGFGLVSPARFLVSRYIKGSGPSVVRVRTGIERRSNGLTVSSESLVADPGDRKRLHFSLRGNRRFIRPSEEVVSNTCSGDLSLRRQATAAPGTEVSARIGRLRVRAFAERGVNGLRCVAYRRRQSRGSDRACGRISARRRAVVDLVELAGRRMVVASGPGLRQISVETPAGPVTAPASGRGRIALLRVAAPSPAGAGLEVVLTFADSVTQTVRAR